VSDADKLHLVLIRIRIRGSMDLDPDPTYFVIDLQGSNKNELMKKVFQLVNF
jgi:hypothetical protein